MSTAYSGTAARPTPLDDARPDARVSPAAAPTEGEATRTRHRVTALVASGTLVVGLPGGVGIGRATAPASTGVGGQGTQGGFGGPGAQGGFGGPGAQGGAGGPGFQGGTSQQPGT